MSCTDGVFGKDNVAARDFPPALHDFTEARRLTQAGRQA